MKKFLLALFILPYLASFSQNVDSSRTNNIIPYFGLYGLYSHTLGDFSENKINPGGGLGIYLLGPDFVQLVSGERKKFGFYPGMLGEITFNGRKTFRNIPLDSPILGDYSVTYINRIASFGLFGRLAYQPNEKLIPYLEGGWYPRWVSTTRTTEQENFSSTNSDNENTNIATRLVSGYGNLAGYLGAMSKIGDGVYFDYALGFNYCLNPGVEFMPAREVIKDADFNPNLSNSSAYDVVYGFAEPTFAGRGHMIMLRLGITFDMRYSYRIHTTVNSEREIQRDRTTPSTPIPTPRPSNPRPTPTPTPKPRP